jgi:hypothetical protein
MRRGVIRLCLAGIAAAAVAASLLAGWSSDAPRASGEGAAGAGGAPARRAALLDARKRLESLLPPPGAHPVAHLPKGLHLSSPGVTVATPNFIDLHALWTVSEAPARVLEWLKAHPPPGSTLTMEGSAGDHGLTITQEYGFGWPELGGEVRERALLVAVAARGSGGTALRADSQAVWVSPHPASERIPAAVRVLEIEKRAGGQAPKPVLVRNAKTVRAVAALIDGLPVAQPGVRSCPEIPAETKSVRLTFWRSRAGAPLAEAVQKLPPGCGHGLELTIHGKREPVLEEGWVLLRRLRGLLARARGSDSARSRR